MEETFKLIQYAYRQTYDNFTLLNCPVAWAEWVGIFSSAENMGFNKGKSPWVFKVGSKIYEDTNEEFCDIWDKELMWQRLKF